MRYRIRRHGKALAILGVALVGLAYIVASYYIGVWAEYTLRQQVYAAEWAAGLCADPQQEGCHADQGGVLFFTGGLVGAGAMFCFAVCTLVWISVQTIAEKRRWSFRKTNQAGFYSRCLVIPVALAVMIGLFVLSVIYT